MALEDVQMLANEEMRSGKKERLRQLILTT
jgi:hypothetical protein